MKQDIHPQDYRLVVFQDTSSDFKILTRSTATSSETTKWEDGQEYPLIKVHVSSASHPFFTGEEKIMDIEGRVDKFKARTEAAKKAREAKQAPVRGAAPKPKKVEVEKTSEENQATSALASEVQTEEK